MNRNDDHLDPAFDPRIADWLEADPDRAPREVLDTILAALPSISQRRAMRVPWRFPEMFTPTRAAMAAVVGVLLIGGAVLVSQRPGTSNVGALGPSQSATTSPASARPSATQSPDGAPLGLAIVNLDGSVRQELGLPVDAWMADLSGDGSKIAFTTSDLAFALCGGCGQSRYPAVVENGGGNGKFVYPEPAALQHSTMGHLAWSPDGTQLAFTAENATGNLDVYVAEVTADGAEPIITGRTRRLTTDPAIDEFPAWTPDGATIVYANLGTEPPDDSGFSYTQEIWKIAVDGGEPVRLTTNEAADTMPDVRSDGTIAFWRDGQTFTMALDGSGETRLANVPDAFNPRWSPDGSKLAMLRYDATGRAAMPSAFGLRPDYPLLQVIVVDPATGEITVVGPRVASDVNPVSWTPDGGALLIARFDDGG